MRHIVKKQAEKNVIHSIQLLYLNFDTVTLIFELAIYIQFLIGHVGWGKGVIYNDYHFANCDTPVLPTHFQ